MIWFMAPDLPEASGGTKILYRIVEELESAGYPARVWHGTSGLTYSSFESTAKVRYGLTLDLHPGDVLVMHEVGGPHWSFLAGASPVVMLCQGWSFVFQDIAVDDRLNAGYPGWPRVTDVLATSRYVERTVRAMSGPGLPVHRVPVVVEPATFQPGPKRRTVAFMPRRRRLEITAALQILRRRGQLAGWTFEPIDGLTERQVGRRLGEAAIFVSGAEREGFGLPAAEAMAAGCYVVGFTGDGGAEFMDPSVCTVVHDSDVLSLADGIAAAADLFDNDRASYDATVRGAEVRIVETYNRTQMRSALVQAFDQICAAGSPALVRTPTQVPHYQSHAPRPGLAHAAYRQARHVVGRVLDSRR